MPTTLRSRPMMNAAERDAVALRHAILLEHASQRSWRPLIIAVTVVAYCLFSWWMFNVGDTLRRANWGIAGTYLADWVSYEVRPEFDIAKDGAMTLSYPRFSPLGDHPNPDWLTVEKRAMTRTVGGAAVSGGAASATAKPSMGFMGAGAVLGDTASGVKPATQTVTEEVVARAEVRYNGSTRIEITPDVVVAEHGGERLAMRLDHQTGAVEPKAPCRNGQRRSDRARRSRSPSAPPAGRRSPATTSPSATASSAGRISCSTPSRPSSTSRPRRCLR